MSSPRLPEPDPIPVTVLDRDPRHLVTAQGFASVAATVRANNPGMAADLAERIAAEALKFLAMIGRFRNRRVAPSRVVDEGWHALILHTALYADLCQTLGGFIHHYPEPPDPTRYNGEVIRTTTQLMAEAGYPADLFLWGSPGTGQIAVAASCEHSPPDCQVSCMNQPK